MSVNNKVIERAILSHLSPGFGGTRIPDWMKSWLEKGLGGVTLFSSNCPSIEETANLIAELRRYTPHVIISIDEEGGDVTRLFVREGSPFPTPAMLGRSDDLELTMNSYMELGKILKQVGIDLNLAPVADVSVNQLNPIVGVRSFGSNFELVTRHLKVAVEGLRRAGIASSIKHFPGHGGVLEDSHHDLPQLEGDLKEIESTHLKPFLTAIEAGVDSIMMGHIVTPALDKEFPASLSKKIITSYLKQKLGFTGIVMTDALDMGAIGGPKKIALSALQAVRAGADLLCFSGLSDQSSFIESSFTLINDAVNNGDMSAEAIISNAERLQSWRPPKPQGSSAPQPLPLSKIADGFEINGDMVLRGEDVVLVELSADPTIAAGFVSWGMRRALIRIGKKVKLESSNAVSHIEPNAQVVVAFRDAYRDQRILNILHRIEKQFPNSIFIDMGWPTREFQPSNMIRTFGSSEIAAEAVAEIFDSSQASLR